MRKFELTIATTPAELRNIAAMLERQQESDPSMQMSVRVNWYHTAVTFVHEKDLELPELQQQSPDPLKGKLELSERFIGSTIKEVFHKSTCFYAAVVEHPVEFQSVDDAIAQGKQPCSKCLPELYCRVRVGSESAT